MNVQELVSIPAGDRLDLLLSDVFYSEVARVEYRVEYGDFSPSRSLSDCHNLILVMRKKFWCPFIEGAPLGMWRVKFVHVTTGFESDWVLDDSFLLAVCHSVLVALNSSS